MEELKKLIEEISAKLQAKMTEQAEEIKKSGEESAELKTEIETLRSELTSKTEEMNKKAEELEATIVELKKLPAVHTSKREEKNYGFNNLGEFIQAAVSNSKRNPSDTRLQKINEVMESEKMDSTGASQGFMIPQFRKDMSTADTAGGDYIPELWGTPIEAYSAKAGIFRPRSVVVPAGSPADAKIHFPALDQGTNGVYAGVEVSWISEGDAKPQTDAITREIVMEPYEVAAHIVLTDKLLRNAPAMSAIVESLLLGAVLAAEDKAFFEGTGSGQPTGILGHSSAEVVTRASANEFVAEDAYNMYAKSTMSGNMAWIVNQTVIPQLFQLADAAGNNIFIPSITPGMPATLLGMPVIISERSKVLGTSGDVALVDFSKYYIKDGSGPFISASEHVQFINNKTVVKICWNVDGKPAVVNPLTLEDGSETVSPFVFLS